MQAFPNPAEHRRSPCCCCRSGRPIWRRTRPGPLARRNWSSAPTLDRHADNRRPRNDIHLELIDRTDLVAWRHAAAEGRPGASSTCVACSRRGSRGSRPFLVDRSGRRSVDARDDPKVAGVTATYRAKTGGIERWPRRWRTSPKHRSPAARWDRSRFKAPLPPEGGGLQRAHLAGVREASAWRTACTERGNTCGDLTYLIVIEGLPQNSVTAVAVDRSTPHLLQRAAHLAVAAIRHDNTGAGRRGRRSQRRAGGTLVKPWSMLAAILAVWMSASTSTRSPTAF